MAIKYGKGLRGALGRMPNVGYEYVPLPYKEMMTGNLMRQEAYDKGQETIEDISDLYNQPVMEEDRALLESKEEAFNTGLDEQIEAVGGDIGKLSGFLNSQFRQVSRDKDYARAVSSKTAYDKYYEDLMAADIDPQIKALKLRQSKANYMGAGKEIFQGASYIDMNQVDFDKDMREIAKTVPSKKFTEQVRILVNKDTGLEFEVDPATGRYIGATDDNSKLMQQLISYEVKDPRELGIVLHNAAVSNGMYQQYLTDLLQSQDYNKEIGSQDLQDFIYNETEGMDADGNPTLLRSGLAKNYADQFAKNNITKGKITPIDVGDESGGDDTKYKPLNLFGAATPVPIEQYTQLHDENGAPMKGSATEKLNQLISAPEIDINGNTISYEAPLDEYSSELSLWSLALENFRENSGREISYTGFEDERPDPKPGYSYDRIYGEGAFDELPFDGPSNDIIDKKLGYKASTQTEVLAWENKLKKLGEESQQTEEGREKRRISDEAAERSDFEKGLMQGMEETLEEATINLGYDLLDEATTSKGVKNIIKQLNIAANADWEALGIDLLQVNNKGDKEGKREPTDSELRGNFTDVVINQYSKRPIYDAQKGTTGYRVRGTFKGVDENLHSFDAVINTDNPLLYQMYHQAELPPVSETSISLGKLLVKGQVVTPPILEELSKEKGEALGVYADPGGGYLIVEVDTGVRGAETYRPKTDKKGSLIVVPIEGGSRFSTINEVANYLEQHR